MEDNIIYSNILTKGPGRCCVNGACDSNVTTKTLCEECVREFSCIRMDDFSSRIVASCSECVGDEYCDVSGPLSGVCGEWLPDGDNCSAPGKCSDSVCVSGLPSEFYGGTFRAGDYPGLSAPNGGYRGPHDSSGTFSIQPNGCGSWVIYSDKQTGSGYLYIQENIGGGCLDKSGRLPLNF